MPEEIKERILNFLKDNKPNKFSLSEISESLNISFPSVSKWVEVLIAENLVKFEDYGNLKLVWVE
jgi:Mn-dependent DtxR family transcriptional regulator